MKRHIKIYLFVLTLYLIPCNANCQSFILMDTINNIIQNGDTIVVTGDSAYNMLEVQVNVQNISATGKMVLVQKIKLNEQQGSSCGFNWGFSMYDTSVNVSSVADSIGSGLTANAFLSWYEPNGNYGSSFYRYVFYDMNNRNDSSSLVIEFNVVNATRINENLFNDHILFYPNPVSDYIKVDFRNGLFEKKKINIFNESGRQIISDIIYSNVTTIGLENFKNGLYFLEIISDVGDKITHFRFVVIK